MRVIVALLVVVGARDATASCSLGTIVAPSFPNYNVYASSPNDTTGSIVYSCTLGLSVTIDLSRGSGTYAARTLTHVGGGATLSYNLPKTIVSRVKLNNVRLFVTGKNLLTFTNYAGWDPEVNADDIVTNIAQGYDFYTAPQARTIIGGINIGF